MKTSNLEELFIKDDIKGGDLVVDTLKEAVKSNKNCIIIGGIGSGKTSVMRALLEHISSGNLIKTIEDHSKIDLREIAPNRDIISYSDSAEANKSLDAFEQVLGRSGIGESTVVLDELIDADKIRYGVRASYLPGSNVIAATHSHSTYKVVDKLSDPLVKSGVFADMNVARQTITPVVDVVVLLNRTPQGERYVESISKSEPINNNNKFFCGGVDDCVLVDFLKFDVENRTYYLTNE
jgi:type IV secretory pathway ATPase VirB11/archaellum biosynthesis ATPase